MPFLFTLTRLKLWKQSYINNKLLKYINQVIFLLLQIFHIDL